MKTLGERIKAAREAMPGKMSQRDLAKLIGIEQQSVADLESGKTKTTKHLHRYADALRQDITWLDRGVGEMRPPSQRGGNVIKASRNGVSSAAAWVQDVVSIRVIAAVQAGVWSRAFEWSLDDQYETPVRLNPKYRGLKAVGLEVRGASMNKVYPPGTILICVSFIDLGREPIHGEHVVVQRRSGDDVEASVKEYRRDADGAVRLWPLSTHPDFQAPMRLDAPAAGEEVFISHKVVQAQIEMP